jgi:deoxyribodipyrimidine photolyase-related protein
MKKTVRLILGDQLNSNHSWYETVDDSITYVLMEIRTETDYAASYPKVLGFFSAMRAFAIDLNRKQM